MLFPKLIFFHIKFVKSIIFPLFQIYVYLSKFVYAYLNLIERIVHDNFNLINLKDIYYNFIYFLKDLL